MRIAQIAPIGFRTPPKKYGGHGRMIHALTEELVRRGHDVTLFASGDSITSAKLEFTEPVNTSEVEAPPAAFDVRLLRHVGRAFAQAGRFDIVHYHAGGLGVPLAEMSPVPVVITRHVTTAPAYEILYREFRRPYLVAISRDQYKDHVALGHHSVGVIHHGLPMEHYPFSREHDGYLLNVGSIWSAKGTHHAINVARRLNMPLIIAARLGEDEPAQRYYREEVEPLLSDTIRWIGEVGEEERNTLMSRAMAFLHPGTWREPFGLALIEAMACGAPVVAFGNGSIPEIVEDGKTGYIVKDEDEMVEAVKNIGTIDRAYCRASALKRFSPVRMADEYEALFKDILAGRR